MMSDTQNRPNIQSVVERFIALQGEISSVLEGVDGGKKFIEDAWTHANGGGGRSRVLEGGAVFEKAGVNFSHVKGDALPASASAERGEIAGKPFEACGVSLVVHPLNPFVPTSHMNVRLFIADPESESPVWWFGGGYDLTPYYLEEEDCVHWHQTARDVCDQFDPAYYPKFKEWCDQYFYLKHRNEPRGIGGLFFDDFTDGGFERAFSFVSAVGQSYIDAYLPIVRKRRDAPYNDRHRAFQAYRRGRYVEFNLVFDRGTIFGLQSGGRTESILMSLPPIEQWRYNWHPEPGSPEQKLYDVFSEPRDWLA